MAIKRYTAAADTTITNAYKTDLSTRATGSNMGASDILEVFHIFGAASTTIAASSSEAARSLIKFSSDTISADRAAGSVPASGSVSFYLRLFNAEHGSTLPKDYSIVVHPISGGTGSNWSEGTGVDMDTYLDAGYCNWTASYSNSSGLNYWNNEGGDFYSASNDTYEYSFDTGTEDILLDVTSMMEEWIAGTRTNHGLIVKLSSSYEDAERSYYTKKFFARGTQYYYKRPLIEARWNSSRKDQRGNFYYSSSLAPAEDNLNTLYLYNYIRGQLRDIPAVGTGEILVSLYSGSSKNTAPGGDPLKQSAGGDVTSNLDLHATGGWVSTGVYSASLCLTASTSSPSQIFDMWWSGSEQYHTGTLYPTALQATSYNPTERYVSKIVNLKSSYYTHETARFRLFARQKDWSPTIYSKASKEISNYCIESASFKVIRVVDEYEVISFGTASTQHTALSYDVSGNYFDMDMGMFEPDYAYAIKLAYYNGALGAYEEQPEEYRFRVERHEP
ncbi:MAG TPA: hypothetical protein EYN67_08550 [Flavobacteriales bacterium]|jgi:hypothetical protein|nr:hypothetical protein [Flavobacteriales bacterium]